jgi:hypothetical protein
MRDEIIDADIGFDSEELADYQQGADARIEEK